MTDPVQPPNQGDVLVVGAGPTGLVLALSLVRAGVLPRVVDARPAIEAESRALDVQARTLELYDQLGVAGALLDRGTRIHRLDVRTAGRLSASVDLTDVGRGLSPYPFLLCCPQDEHERLLVDALAAAGVQVERSTTLLSAREEGDRVRVTLRGPDGTERESDVAYLCGSDGARSAVRQALAVPFRGDASEQAYFVADVIATGPAAPAEPSGRGSFAFCLDEDDFVLVVPAERDRTTRVIGRVPATPGTGRRGTDVGFEDLRAMVERATASRIDRVRWFSTYRVSHRVVDHLRRGRVFLLGDAGHLHSPLGGQGMNTGIADAVNLGWKLAAVRQHRADPALLDSYEPERIAFARSLVATTDRLFRLVDGAGRRHRWARSVLFRTLLPTALRLRATRGAVIGGVSQVRVHYRSSPLSTGRARRVRGGDRLPWVPAPAVRHDATVQHSEDETPRSNYDLLRSLDWQLHVYGTATAEVHRTAARRGLALHELGWSTAARTAGLRRDALYLVRPDGYLALVQASQRVAPLEELLDTYALLTRPAPSPQPEVSGAGAR